MDRQKPRVPRSVVAVAVAVGIAAGSYGIANAASGSGSSASSGSLSLPRYAAQAIAASPSAPGAQGPWGGQRSDETLLAGDAKANVEKVALAKVPNGTIIRSETDADGNAFYEAHMTKADGTPVTVYIDKSFNVVGVQSR